MYDYGMGVSKDKRRAVALYQKACEGGDQWGCRQERRTRVAHAE
jgi:TPR repeat protein